MKTALATTALVIWAAVAATSVMAADSAPRSRPVAEAAPPSVQSLAAVQADADAVKARPAPAQKAYTVPAMADRG